MDLLGRMFKPASLVFGQQSIGTQRAVLSEEAFRKEWDRSSGPVLRLLSLLSLLTWMTAWRNITTHCAWSFGLCKVIEAVCCCMCACQAYYQVLMMRHPGWSVPEPNKAWVWVFDLICSMIFVLLLRDLEEVPGGTHGWIFGCHGWAALFLQATSVSALHLHALNLLCYALVEAYVIFEFGLSASTLGSMRQFLLLLGTCGVAPYAINVIIEAQRRQSFLSRRSPTGQ